jgi:4-hydroxybenzoate polyprenyltransferase
MIHYLKLVRPINLMVLALSMLLFRYMIIEVPMKMPNGDWESYYLMYGFKSYLSSFGFYVLFLLTLLVAAGGYVINDIMDVEADRINKPDRLLIEQHLPEQKAFTFYKILVGLSVLLSIVLMIETKQMKISGIPLLVTVILYLYAQLFKRMALVGNIIISVCAALPFILIALYDLRINEFDVGMIISITRSIGMAALFYGGFAFLTTLIREIIKDMEDVEGDLAIDARTLPIAIGIPFTKAIVVLLQVITAGLLSVVALYFLAVRAPQPFYGLMVLMILPLLLQLVIVLLAKDPARFRLAGNVGKVHMLLGVLSMLYFRSGVGAFFFENLETQIKLWLR